jgi:hypothetical protein
MSTHKPHVRRRANRCQENYTACPLPGRKNLFECVDVMNDIQSCGACWSTGEGEDCTAFDDLATASCVMGKCQYKCPIGYNLTPTGCIPAPRHAGNGTATAGGRNKTSNKVFFQSHFS